MAPALRYQETFSGDLEIRGKNCRPHGPEKGSSVPSSGLKNSDMGESHAHYLPGCVEIKPGCCRDTLWCSKRR